MLPQNSALIIVDVQNGFCPGGNLAVNGADQIIPLINRLAQKFKNIILTQDWHPENHVSFAKNHLNKKPYDSIELAYGTQVLWPAHCVQGTDDAELHPLLNVPAAQLVIRKGFHPDIDSYSAFLEADQETVTGLAGYLKERRIDTVYIAGIATDFCVAWTAMDARQFGFNTFVIEDATKAIDLEGSLEQAWQQMLDRGVQRIQSDDLFKVTVQDE
ncbi:MULTISPECIES: bifunctional nicotinamidase/pyrazinamidase [Acinetobacter]|jgi:nicotinamidase/pyrazinamidase|uniref:Nicotinamidase n=1 Tax=Acinetobacter radioresistens TaxID=40216 RepID=A0A3D3FY88_ACIRA|nr:MULTISPECIES: bifunctional nicotinamidase/pyrazinamidase [Acinetobacter]EXB35478.1 isochorismatase family protein [Acinetobacter sp. 1461402]EXB73357.1 isochorismatase family protein [Acinetobacter sp. 230853]EXE15026.1 isochorismatase family protein [Acinetobacter sp. 983759]KCX39578.1 isochorismatase family protein [Acinetobacter sp. 263903-1]MCM1933853.1 bifunctional nicotinamidase/pyrazinamidase [Acinetobacter radioresistens]